MAVRKMSGRSYRPRTQSTARFKQQPQLARAVKKNGQHIFKGTKKPIIIGISALVLIVLVAVLIIFGGQMAGKAVAENEGQAAVDLNQNNQLFVDVNPKAAGGDFYGFDIELTYPTAAFDDPQLGQPLALRKAGLQQDENDWIIDYRVQGVPGDANNKKILMRGYKNDFSGETGRFNIRGLTMSPKAGQSGDVTLTKVHLDDLNPDDYIDDIGDSGVAAAGEVIPLCDQSSLGDTFRIDGFNHKCVHAGAGFQWTRLLSETTGYECEEENANFVAIEDSSLGVGGEGAVWHRCSNIDGNLEWRRLLRYACDNDNQCVLETGCSGGICKLKEGRDGCMGFNEFCVAGLTCDGDTCVGVAEGDRSICTEEGDSGPIGTFAIGASICAQRARQAGAIGFLAYVENDNHLCKHVYRGVPITQRETDPAGVLRYGGLTAGNQFSALNNWLTKCGTYINQITANSGAPAGWWRGGANNYWYPITIQAAENCIDNPDAGVAFSLMDNTCPLRAPPAAACTANTLGECRTEAECTANGGAWNPIQAIKCGPIVAAPCAAAIPDGCQTQAACEGVGAVWDITQARCEAAPPAVCDDQCTEGETRCANDRNIETCELQSDGCTDWIDSPCGPNIVCDAGICRAQNCLDRDDCPQGDVCIADEDCLSGFCDTVGNDKFCEIRPTLSLSSPTTNQRVDGNVEFKFTSDFSFDNAAKFIRLEEGASRLGEKFLSDLTLCPTTDSCSHKFTHSFAGGVHTVDLKLIDESTDGIPERNSVSVTFSVAVCDVANFDGCITQASCTAAGGVWDGTQSIPCTAAVVGLLGDTDGDGCVKIAELMVYISKWKGNPVTYPMANLISVISAWKNPAEACSK